MSLYFTKRKHVIAIDFSMKVFYSSVFITVHQEVITEITTPLPLVFSLKEVQSFFHPRRQLRDSKGK